MKLLVAISAGYVAIVQASATPSCPSKLTNIIEIGDDSTLHYAMVPSSSSDTNNGILCGRLEVLNADGNWIGFAMSKDYGMFGSEAIIGLPIDTLSPDGITKQNTVMKYKLGGYNVGSEVGGRSVYYMSEEKQTLLDTSLVQEINDEGEEVMVMTFTKSLIEDEEIPILENGTNVFLYALGTTPTLGPHAGYGLSFAKDFSEDVIVEVVEDSTNDVEDALPTGESTNGEEDMDWPVEADANEGKASTLETGLLQPTSDEVQPNASGNTNTTSILLVGHVLTSFLVYIWL